MSKSPGRTALLGAGVGSAAGAVQAGPGDRIHGGVMGALKGGLVGGVGGGLGRAYRDTKLLKPTLTAPGAIGETAKRLGTQVANFGKRQVHGLTGAFKHDQIGMAGNATARREAKLLKLRGADEARYARGAKKQKILKSTKEDVADTLREGRESQSLANSGITTLPGIGKALMNKNTRGKAVKAMGRSIIHGPGGAKLSLGVPALVYGPSLARGDESATGGQTVKRKLMGMGSMIASGAAIGGLPVIPQMAVGEVAGRGYNAARKRLGKPAAEVPA